MLSQQADEETGLEHFTQIFRFGYGFGPIPCKHVLDTCQKSHFKNSN